MGHLGTALTFSVPYGLLGLIGGVLAGWPLLGLALLVFTLALKTAQSMLVGGLAVRSRQAVLLGILYPLRDLIGFLLWAASYGSNKLHWHGRVFELEAGGTMHLPK
jgi:ceramide glucosyltransferase